MRCREMAPARLRGAMNILFQVAGCTIAAAGLLERANHLAQCSAGFARVTPGTRRVPQTLHTHATTFLRLCS